MIKNQTSLTLAQIRETQRSPIKNYNDCIKIANESTSLIQTLPDLTGIENTTLPEISTMKGSSMHKRKQSMPPLGNDTITNGMLSHQVRTPLNMNSLARDTSPL